MTLRVVHYADLEATYDDPERIARVVGLIDSLRDSNTILVGAGDNVAPGALALLTEGEQALSFFEKIQPDVDTLGNHDFDYGVDTLLSVIRCSPQTWVCANAYTDDERFGQDAGVVPWTIIERGGHRIGIFGLSHPLTAEKSPKIESPSFTDPIVAATETIERLREQSVDHVVCVSHLGEAEGHGRGEVDDLAEAVDIDVICDGHTHGKPRIDRVGGTLVARTSGEGVNLNELRFDGEWTATRHVVADTSPDRTTEQTFRELFTSAGLDDVVSTAPTPIERSVDARFHGESRLGNFVTDAYRWAADATVGLQHSAGMRGGPALSGDVTVADLVSIVPFDMDVVRTEITGETLRELLASGGKIVHPEKPAFWQIHLSGGTIVHDYAERELTAATIDGQPIDPDKSYRVAAPENLLQSIDDSLVDDAESFGRQYDVLTQYTKTTKLTPTVEGRITLKGVKTVETGD